MALCVLTFVRVQLVADIVLARLGYYVAFVLILTITALTSIYHKQIVEWLTPVTKWLHEYVFPVACDCSS